MTLIAPLLALSATAAMAGPSAAATGADVDRVESVAVPDRCRGWENAGDPAVRAWSDAEDERTRAYFDALPAVRW